MDTPVKREAVMCYAVARYSSQNSRSDGRRQTREDHLHVASYHHFDFRCRCAIVVALTIVNMTVFKNPCYFHCDPNTTKQLTCHEELLQNYLSIGELKLPDEVLMQMLFYTTA